MGKRVLLTEPTDWLRGQLRQQGVPPDEHSNIETFGCTPSYRQFRENVRDFYRKNYPLTEAAKNNPRLNPGNGSVSRLCHEPRVAVAVLDAMLAPLVSSGRLTVLLNTQAIKAEVDGDRVLLQTSAQQPVLIERPTARGRLLILNDRLDGMSSNLPLQPVFVALMQSMLRYFDASTALPDEIIIGSRLALPAQVQVLDPDDEPLLTLSASAHSGAIELTEPGLYTIIGVRGEHALQVVLDSRETDLTTVDPAALDAWQGRHLDDAGAAGSAGDGAEQAADRLLLAQGADESRWAAWQFILPLLVLALLMEGGFANRRLDVRRDGS